MADEIQPPFRKSSFSESRIPLVRCVEVSVGKEKVKVRHSKHPEIAIHFAPEEWDAFVLGVKNHEFDIPRV